MDRSEAGKLGWLASKDKHNAHWVKYRKNYESKPRKCKHCNNPLPYKKRHNKFCNHTCAAKHTNLGVRRHFNPDNFIVCSACGVEVHLKSKTSRKYCFSCSPKQEKITSSEMCSTTRALRRYLLRIKDSICAVCANSIWMGKPIPLEVDHIDGNHKNNTENNVRLICPNCHVQTSTYKGRNRGNGRAKRRKRYREGKSY